jgi:hypothetical protein
MEDITRLIDTISTSTIEGIISRGELLNNITNIDTGNLVLIYISEPYREGYEDEQLPDKICYKFKNFIKLKFWDIEEDFGDYKIISDEVAECLQDFITANIEERFLIHCKAGQSRSAAVGQAIECIKYFGVGVEAKYNYQTGFNSEISRHYRYYPNLTVFDKIVKEYI